MTDVCPRPHGATRGTTRSRTPDDTQDEENRIVNAKVVVTIVVIAFAAFMVVTQPQTSADAVHAAFSGVTTVFRSLATFVGNL